MESAITLLGNAFAQMSVLRRQRVLEEYNKELLTSAQGREAEFLKTAPELLGPKFPHDDTEHLGNAFAQMSVLCRQRVLEEYNKELPKEEKRSSSRLLQNF